MEEIKKAKTYGYISTGEERGSQHLENSSRWRIDINICETLEGRDEAVIRKKINAAEDVQVELEDE